MAWERSKPDVAKDGTCIMLGAVNGLDSPEKDMYLHCETAAVDVLYLTPVVPSVSKTTPASFHLALVASSDLVQYGSVSYTAHASLQIWPY